jgi:KUP system potassium uptake protein
MVKTKKMRAALVLGAVGIVFGDIGTSPLYAVQSLFGPAGRHIAITSANVYGIIALILWSVFIVVSLKYVLLLMRVDNKGEGGIMALVSIIKGAFAESRAKWLFVFLGLIGMALFYGDSAITPAISVLSAVEGVKVVTPHLAHYVVPVTIAILALLFWLQKKGTAIIGGLFGPVMVIWFLVIGLGGLNQVINHPDVLRSMLPTTALGFLVHHFDVAFIAMAAVVLAITGAEALYADMGHFGRKPIARAWFLLVFPALMLCYMGQGALILHDPAKAASSFYYLFPSELRVSVILLATAATLIASQSVISGAFSITRQAIHLDFIPRLLVKHTSNREVGQIYMPFVNYALFVIVILLVVMFGSSVKLAGAYGIAVSGTLAVDSILFLAVLRYALHKSLGLVLLAACALVPLDILFVTANADKVFHGGWIPVLLAIGVFTLVTTWIRGERIVVHERRALEGSLEDLAQQINTDTSLHRFADQAVYVSHHPNYAPLVLRQTIEELHELPEKVLIVSVVVANEAHIPEDERAEFDSLGYVDGVSQLKLRYGYHDAIDIPKVLKSVRGLSPELDLNPAETSYYISLYKVVITNRHNLSRWRKQLYMLMSRNSLSHSDYYKLPLDKTQEISALIKL